MAWLNPIQLSQVLDYLNSTERFLEEVVQWVSKTSHSSVPIAGKSSFSRLVNRNSLPPKATLTSPSAAHPVVNPGRQTAMVAVASERGDKCTRRYVLSAARKPRYHLSLVKADRCTVASATPKLKQTDNTVS